MPKTYTKRKILFLSIMMLISFALLLTRLSYLMIAKSEYYLTKAENLHQRQRSIKAKRGVIYDRNGVELAGNKPVCSISVIHSQVRDEETVVKALCDVLGMNEEEIRKKVEANTIREKIKSNVDKETADVLRDMKLAGVMIDEDYKRYYPYDELASKVLGFTGSDNQGIVGLEVSYDEVLSGKAGSILTLTDANGVEIKNEAESRIEPIAGNDLHISIDVNIQKYAEQAAKKVQKAKDAKRVSVVLMNPQNGEIYAMVNVPEYNLNEPYKLVGKSDKNLNEKELGDALNNMWRNFCINDTYEPGSTFKTVTATAALEEKVVNVNDTFSCPGFRVVEDRRIKCHKKAGHGTETFKQGIMNSCNPVFIDVGARVGVDKMYKNYEKLGLFEKTGVDLPGEAGSIMHKKENVGAVELATMSFGQSFQITPLQLLRAVSAIINGGKLVTPHFAMYATNENGEVVKNYSYTEKEKVIKKSTSKTMKELLEAVVAEGSGAKGRVVGYRVGGKTATSEKLPRGTGKYISSFLGFAPANNPQIIGLIMIDEPTGIYYGGTIAAPVMSEIFENILPYMGMKADYKQEELKAAMSTIYVEEGD
ncbi:MAG: peptidoglycan glycosyltransferase [Lachnospiraceae bacterium]|jgi:stage V sporulation protein D (sporulation-specific penicillin-binding protein)|nr:peptidoglycan glycosyltransferase [Lachnospiraceae bacterium]